MPEVSVAGGLDAVDSAGLAVFPVELAVVSGGVFVTATGLAASELGPAVVAGAELGAASAFSSGEGHPVKTSARATTIIISAAEILPFILALLPAIPLWPLACIVIVYYTKTTTIIQL